MGNQSDLVDLLGDLADNPSGGNTDVMAVTDSSGNTVQMGADADDITKQ